MKHTACMLALAVGLIGCTHRGAVLQESLERLRWSGGDLEMRYVRDRLVDALQHSTSSSLRQPNLVNIAFHGRSPDAKEAQIVFDWVASPPSADGAILTMRDGTTLQVPFHEAYVGENHKESQAHAICQASVGRILQPEVWVKLDVEAIVTGRLTREGQPVSNVCSFRRHTVRTEGGQPQGGGYSPPVARPSKPTP